MKEMTKTMIPKGMPAIKEGQMILSKSAVAISMAPNPRANAATAIKTVLKILPIDLFLEFNSQTNHYY